MGQLRFETNVRATGTAIQGGCAGVPLTSEPLERRQSGLRRGSGCLCVQLPRFLLDSARRRLLI